MGASTNEVVGNAGLGLLFFFTAGITSCMLYQLPSPEIFDGSWLLNGFCVSNPDSALLNSHSLSFYCDVVLAAILYALYRTAPPPTDENRLRLAILRGSVVAVLGHGCGHMYLGTSPRGGMDLRWKPSEDLARSVASTIVTVGSFATIFNGTMPLASTRKLIAAAAVATAGVTALDVDPRLNFVYAQGFIYASNALHLAFSLDATHKRTLTYALYPFLQLPALLVGVLESTACRSFLAGLGGHAVFDASIALGLIAMGLVARRRDDGEKKKGN